MTVVEFIAAINETIPTTEQILKKHQWQADDTGISNAKRVQDEDYRITITNAAPHTSHLEYLIYNTNLCEWQMQIGCIIFNREINPMNENEHLLFFATLYDQDKICLNTKDGSIVQLDDYDEAADELSISLSQFLDFLVIQDKYVKHQVWDLHFPKPHYSNEINRLIENGLSSWFVSFVMHDWPWKS